MIGDTIAAIASGTGEAGVGIIRISGEKACDIAGHFFSGLKSQKPRFLALGVWKSKAGIIQDEVLCVRFKGPSSYTGEDMVEVHAHGGYLNLNAILQNLLQKGARLARPGEFTQRAFLNGKMDLTKAEAVADMISARADLSLQMASSQLAGSLFAKVENWRQRIMDLSAQSEAAVDFPEEEDQIAPKAEQLAAVKILLYEIRDLLKSAHTGRLLREGFRIALVGKPNAGKSSLLNAVLGQERAIVTEVKGTTRDFLEESFQYKGFPFVFVDTAGLRLSEDRVEAEGIRRSKEQMLKADLRILLMDASETLSAEDEVLLKDVPEPRMLVANKRDLPKRWEHAAGINPHRISCVENLGIVDLLESILQRAAGENLDAALSEGLLSRQRHADALQKTENALSHVQETLELGNMGPEFVAGDLRSALDSLGELVGKTTREEILNLIFSKFCIGK